MKKIDIDDNNSKYMDIDGVCYSKDGKMLIAYPPAKDITGYVLPDFVEKLGDFCLSETNIETMELPEKLTYIEYGVLSNCEKLTSLKIDTDAYETSMVLCKSLKNCQL